MIFLADQLTGFYTKLALRDIAYPIKGQCSPSNKNQSNGLQSKSTDWFLYHGEHWSLMD